MPQIIDINLFFVPHPSGLSNLSFAVFGDPPLPPKLSQPRTLIYPGEINDIQHMAKQQGYRFVNLQQNIIVEIGILTDNQWKQSWLILLPFPKSDERFKDFETDIDMVRQLPPESQNESIRRIAIADYNGEVFIRYKKSAPPHE